MDGVTVDAVASVGDVGDYIVRENENGDGRDDGQVDMMMMMMMMMKMKMTRITRIID